MSKVIKLLSYRYFFQILSLYSFYILYDFSGHKTDLEGKIQICFKYGTMETVFCLKVLLLGVRSDVRSAKPVLHVFYSDDRSEKTWILSVKRVQVF